MDDDSGQPLEKIIMKKGILFIVLAVLAVGVCFTYSQPEFAILEAKWAIEHKALENFEHAVDVDAVSHNLAADLINKPINNVLGSGAVANWLTSNLSSLFLDDLTKSIKSEIKSSVGSGTLLVKSTTSGATSSDTKLADEGDELGFNNYRYAGMVYSQRITGPTECVVTLIFHSDRYKSDLAVKVGLSRAEGDWHWKVSQIVNFTDVVAQMVEEKAKDINSR